MDRLVIEAKSGNSKNFRYRITPIASSGGTRGGGGGGLSHYNNTLIRNNKIRMQMTPNTPYRY